jgi:hypothetical protein
VSDPHASAGPAPTELSDDDLLREIEQLHRTRHETFLHGSESALKHPTRRTVALEEEYLRRTPDRDVDEERLRSGRRDNV